MGDMSFVEFVEELESAWDAVEDFEGELSDQTELVDIGAMDSLTIMSLVAMAKVRAGKIVSGDDLMACSTVEDLYKLMA